MWPKALKSCPKSNKSPNLVTLVEMRDDTRDPVTEVVQFVMPIVIIILHTNLLSFSAMVNASSTCRLSDVGGNLDCAKSYYIKSEDNLINDIQEQIMKLES